MRPPELL